MKRRFILYRGKLGGTFYVEDTETRKQEIQFYDSSLNEIGN